MSHADAVAAVMNTLEDAGLSEGLRPAEQYLLAERIVAAVELALASGSPGGVSLRQGSTFVQARVTPEPTSTLSATGVSENVISATNLPPVNQTLSASEVSAQKLISAGQSAGDAIEKMKDLLPSSDSPTLADLAGVSRIRATTAPDSAGYVWLDHEGVVQKLIAQPGRWFELDVRATGALSTAANLAQKIRRGDEPYVADEYHEEGDESSRGEFQAVVRAGSSRVFARFKLLDG